MQKLKRSDTEGNQKKPIKMIQFGGGNFLRAFVDSMVDVLSRKGLFNGSVMVVDPIPCPFPNRLEEQGGLYTVLSRGMQDGWTIQKSRLIECVAGEVRPYEDWDAFLELARCETVEFVCSNTTEAGIAYVNTEFNPKECPASFPAKVTLMLLERFKHFSGDTAKGLVFLTCELIENNGDNLKKCVLQHCADWNLGEDFTAWIENNCAFCNTLVDCIVTGYPAAEAEELCKKFGYEDNLLVTCEPYTLFAIDDKGKLRDRLPLDQSGAGVIWTDNIKLYRERKVKVLNGGHTGNVLGAYLCGLDTVGEMMADPLTSGALRKMLFSEVLPTIDLPQQEKEAFASAVVERFSNPFIRHELLAISLNSTSKWKVRVLPSLRDSYNATKKLPALLSFSLAALCVFYKTEKQADGSYCGQRDGKSYPVNDTAEACEFFRALWDGFDGDYAKLSQTILANTEMWGEDLNAFEGLTTLTATNLEAICKDGMRTAISNACGDN